MESKLRSWWELIHKYQKAINVYAIILIVVIVLIIMGYLFDWTGFGGYSIIWIAKTTNGTSLPFTRLEEQQPAKTLWDWLQLLAALAVPVVVAFGVAWFTAQRAQSEREAAVSRAETEREITLDNQREAALQEYIDKMSELLLKEHLDELTPDGKLKPEYDKTRKIARVRTSTILFQLDARRIGYIFAFLREAGLISNKPNSNIVSLSLADLSKINLSGANLIQANLSAAILIQANLCDANLSDTNLSDADLSDSDLMRANLSGAILIRANLVQANLSDAILMRANFSGANLLEADLTGANLYNANLSEADLTGANLYDANLSEANLSNANLSEAMITEEQLKEAKSLQGTTLPDGKKYA